MSTLIKTINTSVLSIAYLEYGSASGWPCIMGHGFPYDAHAYDQAAPILAEAGARVIVPYLRGYGPTRFLKAETPRSGEQAALGVDLLDFMDALKIERAVLGGYDWGGRAACIVAALLPERVVALVSGNSYNIQSIAHAMEPASPSEEAAFWYQYYFHSERGRRGLTKNRREMARLLWRMWSPNWAFDDATFDRTASAFDNPDFVAVVIHSYRHRYGLAPGAGDPRYDEIEMGLAAQPPDRRSCHHHRWRRGRREPRHGAPREEIHRPARTSHIQGRRPQPAAGAAGGMGARGHRRAKDGERLGNEWGYQPLTPRGGGSRFGDQ